jgi:hypothetical protein
LSSAPGGRRWGGSIRFQVQGTSTDVQAVNFGEHITEGLLELLPPFVGKGKSFINLFVDNLFNEFDKRICLLHTRK